MKNIFLRIAYDGTNFSGWQRQPGVRTVCGELEDVLFALAGEKITLNGTSRTDAGVHANGQCASFTTDMKIPTENLTRVLNSAFGTDRLESIGEIRILEAKEMPEDFHARFSSKGKRYIYKIKNRREPSVFDRNYYYQVRNPLDLEAMKAAAKLIEGEHDFAGFQTAGSPKETTVRNVYSIAITKHGDEIQIAVSGNGFLYNMVRIIVGTLVEVGLGKLDLASVEDAVNKADRSKAGHVAPAHGLYLDEVFFEE